MIQAFIPLFQPIQEEYGKGLDKLESLQYYGEEMGKRLARLAEVVRRLEEKGWKWHTTYDTIALFKEIPTEAAAEEFVEAGLEKGEFHFGYPK